MDKTMTLDEALKLVYRELGIWQEGQPCKGGYIGRDHPFASHPNTPHDIPMPPIHDGLLAVIIKHLNSDGCTVSFRNDRTIAIWKEGRCWIGTGALLEAAVLAFAEMLRAKEEGHAD